MDDDSPQTRPKAVQIKTGSRLHFGLLDTADPFGGVGVMIEHPGTSVIVSESGEFECDATVLDRVRPIAERIAELTGAPHLPKCHVTLESQPPAHCGFGSGSQLALAVAEAITQFVGASLERTVLVTQVAQRGQRSAVGVHGYFSGGILFDHAESKRALNPLQRRVEPPEQWCLAILRPSSAVASVSGDVERKQFSHLGSAGQDASINLRRVITERMLPAADDGDFAALTDSVQEYNELSGQLFADVQGGSYNGPEVTRSIKWLIENGARGVGQSSWGPGIFTWFESRNEAEAFVKDLPEEISLIALTHPRNAPRTIETC